MICIKTTYFGHYTTISISIPNIPDIKKAFYLAEKCSHIIYIKNVIASILVPGARNNNGDS